MAQALWSKAELAAWAADLGGEWRGEPRDVSGISIDSRTLQASEAFFAIKGEHFDGHDYAQAAADKGAALLALDKAHENLAAGIKAPCLIVADVLAALRALAALARARLNKNARVAAITGSVGKTTLKEMLAQIFTGFGKTHKNPASFNNHWGVPLSLARMPRDTDYALFEIGMSHAGEIAPLAELVKPHLAVITCIAPAHMGHFRSLTEIAAAKAEIFSGLEEDGVVMLNRDDKQYEFLRRAAIKQRARVYSFGSRSGADYQLTDWRANEQGLEFTVKFWKETEEIFMPVHGAHMALNGCAAVAAASELILPDSPNDGTNFAYKFNKYIKPIKAQLAQFTAPAGRGARHILALPGGGSFTLIDESYNANPASMCAALAALADCPGRRIAVLGDMLELGDTAKAEHEALAEKLLEAKPACAFLIGPQMLALAEKLEQQNAAEFVWQENIDELADKIKTELKPGDSLMLKASNSVGFGKIVQALKRDFSPAKP